MPIAYFLLNVVLNQETEIIEKIKKILEEESVEYQVQGVFGIYDIIVKITAESDDRLRHIILEKIKPIDKIQSAITVMVA